MLIFWLSALVFAQSMASSFEEPVEEPVVDSFDFVLHSSGEQMKTRRSDTEKMSEWIDPFEVVYNSHEEKKLVTRKSNKQQIGKWVDPFDMVYYSHQEKRMVRDAFFQSEDANLDSETEGDSKEKKVPQECEGSKMERNFLKRFVNMLINNCENGKQDFLQETTVILKISQGQLQNLRRLRESGENEALIRLLNGITSRMTTDDSPNKFMELLASEEIWSNIGAAGFALIPLCVFILYGTMRKVMCLLSLAVFAVGYFKTYKLMLKKVELQNENTLSKDICNPSERSWFQMLFGSNTDEECLKQLHAMNIDPALEVTPVHVISHMLAIGSFQPIEHFGVVFSRLSKEIFNSHSFLYGWLVFLIAVFVILYIITLCFSGIFGRNLTVGNKHLSLGITGTAHSEARGISTAAENSSGHEVATRQLSETSNVKYEYSHQPVIQIIHNYSSNIIDKPADQYEQTVKKPICEEGAISNRDIKSIKDQDRSQEIVKGEECLKVLEVSKGEDLDNVLEVVKGSKPDKLHEVVKAEEAHKIQVIAKEKSAAAEDDIMQKAQTKS